MTLKELIEVNGSFRRIEREEEVPEELKATLDVPDDAVVVVGHSSWLTRIPLVDGVYIETFPKFGGIGIELNPTPYYNQNLPVKASNDEIIKHIAFAVKGGIVFVYTEKSETSHGFAKGGKTPLDRLTSKLGAEHSPDLKEMDLDFSKFNFFSSISYSEFDERLTALKQDLKERNCYGFTKFEVKLD